LTSGRARTFREATFPRRILVAVAGSSMHFVMAFLLLWGCLRSRPTGGVDREDCVACLIANMKTPAELAGLRPGDILVSIDGHHYTNPQLFVSFIDSHPTNNCRSCAAREPRRHTVDPSR